MSNWQEMEKKYLIHEYRPLANLPVKGRVHISGMKTAENTWI